MQLLQSCIIVLVIVLGPRLMVLLSKRFKLLGMLGPIFLCYALGILVSFLLPDTSLAMDISEILVPIAIPLILFSADFSGLRRLAKPMLVSFALMIVSVLAVSCGAYFLYRNALPDMNKYSGMMIGLYTGGTPNLMAIGYALGVDETGIGLANASDVVVGGVYFLLLLSVMPALAHRFLPPFAKKPAGETPAQEREADALEKTFVPDKDRFSLRMLLSRVPIILLGVASLAVAAGLALLLTGELNVVVIMLVVTTCGIGFSFIKKVREAPGSFSAGQYLIYMFSIGIGMSFNFSSFKAESLLFLAVFATAQFGAVVVHLLLCKLFRIDGDTAVITSTAGIYGPAFIVPTAGALKNDEVILPGLICGIAGYAVGNYLGIGTALLLQLIGG